MCGGERERELSHEKGVERLVVGYKFLFFLKFTQDIDSQSHDKTMQDNVKLA